MSGKEDKKTDSLWCALTQPLEKFNGWAGLDRDVLLISHSHTSPPPAQAEAVKILHQKGSDCHKTQHYIHLSHWIVWNEIYPPPLSMKPTNWKFFYDQYTEKSIFSFKKPIKKFWPFTRDKLCNLLEQKCGITGESTFITRKGAVKQSGNSINQRKLQKKNKSLDFKPSRRLPKVRVEEEEGESSFGSKENRSHVGSSEMPLEYVKTSQDRLHKLQIQLQQARKLQFARNSGQGILDESMSIAFDMPESIRQHLPERKVLIPSKAIVADWSQRYTTKSEKSLKSITRTSGPSLSSISGLPPVMRSSNRVTDLASHRAAIAIKIGSECISESSSLISQFPPLCAKKKSLIASKKG